MFTRVRKFLALDPSEQLMFFQAWWLLGWYRAATLLCSFRFLSRKLQLHRQLPPPQSLTAAQQHKADRIGWLVSAAAQLTPWRSTCLVQVLVLQRLLARRSIPGQFHLGVFKTNSGGSAQSLAGAHAWVQCGDTIVNGGHQLEEVAVIASFSWPSGPRTDSLGV